MTAKRFRIQHKILVGFLVVVSLLGVISGLSYNRFQQVLSTVDDVVKVRQPGAMAAEQVRSELYGAFSALGSYVVTGEEVLKQEFSARLGASRQGIAAYAEAVGDVNAMAPVGAGLDRLEKVGAGIFAASAGYESNYPGIAYANANVNPLTRALLQNANAMLRVEAEGQENPWESRTELILALADLRYAVSSVMRGIRGYLAFRNGSENENIKLYMDEIGKKLDYLSGREDELGFEQVDYLAQMRETLAKLTPHLATMLELHGADTWRTDARLVREGVLPELRLISDRLDKLAKAETTRIEASGAALLAGARTTSTLVLWVSLSGILLALALAVGWLVARIITRPLQNASEAMHQVAVGDGDLTRRIEVHNQDEIGDLAASFNDFIVRIQELVRQTARATSAVIRSVADTNESAGRIADRVIVQQSESQQVATAVTEMSASIAEVARYAADAESAARSAAAEAQRGRGEVELTTTDIQALAQRLEQGAALVARLDADSEAIGSVLDVIKGIAEQTNLLALNAAIEAARAGESGRGFAVVADEVRTLATRTHQSTGEIESMISRLRVSAREVSSLMEMGRSMSDANCAQANKANRSLSAILKAVDSINTLNSQIATAAEEQRVVAEDISRAVESVSAAGQETALEAEQTKNTTEKLGDLAANLQALIGRFKLAGDDAFDFEAAKSAHLAWRARIRTFLDGKGSLQVSEATSHRDCVLGKWYYGPEGRRHAHLSHMQDIEHPHERLHALIREIIELKKANRNQEAEARYAQLATLSEDIVAHLDALERQLSTPADASPMPNFGADRALLAGAT